MVIVQHQWSSVFANRLASSSQRYDERGFLRHSFIPNGGSSECVCRPEAAECDPTSPILSTSSVLHFLGDLYRPWLVPSMGVAPAGRRSATYPCADFCGVTTGAAAILHILRKAKKLESLECRNCARKVVKEYGNFEPRHSRVSGLGC